MKELFISYEQALAIKQAVFQEPCIDIPHEVVDTDEQIKPDDINDVIMDS